MKFKAQFETNDHIPFCHQEEWVDIYTMEHGYVRVTTATQQYLVENVHFEFSVTYIILRGFWRDTDDKYHSVFGILSPLKVD